VLEDMNARHDTCHVDAYQDSDRARVTVAGADHEQSGDRLAFGVDAIDE
jgi:hypothetical protein